MATPAPLAAATPVGGAAAPLPQAIQFRVMRTCAPTLKIDTPSRFALDDLGHPPCAPSTSTSSDVAFESRVDLGLRASRASGVTGTLCLPQAFGNVYLGETFAAYVSAINSSDRVVRDVSFKAELQTERRRVALFDNAAEAAPTMPPGATFDFTATHDLKELGAHTLVCGVVYTDADGERKYAPQYFKFNAANPLAVRTKVRPGRDGRALLEACIENATPAPLLLSRATFEPCAHLECDEIVPACVSGAGVVIPEGDPHRGEEGGGGGGGGGGGARDAAAAGGSGLGEGLPSLANRPLRVLSPQGGSTHFLFELRQRPDITVTSDTLGKLEIRWTGHNGEAGRLQTQQIVGSPRVGGKDVEVAFAHGAPPKTARVHAPLTLSCVVTNKTASATRALEVIAQPDSDVVGGGATGGGGGATGATGGATGGGGGVAGILVDGPQRIAIGALPPGGERRVELTCVPTLPGTRRLPIVSVAEARGDGDARGGRVFDQLARFEVLVER